ncbi:glycosyltransferase family 39 protein [Elioraea rosea]|uniref:glycosyltransferase family 39 protein n=1 Tax=Elioraea rosea TaxID=2492390 RepID=UPI0011855458|nr:glycosyltransferase family 39 protein [Elioraea rosea]
MTDAETPPAPWYATHNIFAVLVIALAVVALYATSPLHGAFWWSDAPRHGLNGIFLKDALTELPVGDPKGFAFAWYAQYPALTILFYPPLFYVTSAPAFLLFGESHAVAQGMVALHLLGLGVGMYALALAWLPPLGALAAALVLLGLPEIALWGRQVMLEIPALCWLVWAAVFAVRHGRTAGTASLFLAAAVLLAALYTKVSMIFAIPALALLLLRARGFGMLAERRVWLAALLFLAGLAPLVLLTLQFGQANVQSVVEIVDTAASRKTLEGWVWYARALPGMLGWLPLALAGLGLVASLLGRAGAWRRGERTMLVLWVVVSYLALSFIELKEARHGVILLVPIAAWIACGLVWLAGLAGRAQGPALAAGAGAALVALTVATEAVPRVDGYEEAARRVAALAPPDSTVLFSGKRDGSFVFSMRTVSGRPDLYTARADKLLLTVAVRRELGVGQREDTEEEILERIRDLGVSVVVAQRDFWTDLAAMARLQHVLDGPGFEEIGRIPVVANVPTEDRELRLYRIRGEVKPRPPSFTIDLPIIGRRIEGEARP